MRKVKPDSQANSPNRSANLRHLVTGFEVQDDIINIVDRQINLRRDKVLVQGDSISQALNHTEKVKKNEQFVFKSDFTSSDEDYNDIYDIDKPLFKLEKFDLPREKVVEL